MNKFIYTFYVNLFFKIALGISVLIILFGCGQPLSTKVYNAYNGPLPAPEKYATILLSKQADDYDYVLWASFNEIHIDHKEYGVIAIPQGDYTISWGRTFAILARAKKKCWKALITLEAGHTYTIHAKRSSGANYKIYGWITDDTVYERVIWGNRYVPGPYDRLRKSNKVKTKSNIQQKEKVLSCPKGYELYYKGHCRKIEITCPEGYEPHAGVCRSMEIHCPEGYYWDKEKGKCSPKVD